MTQTKIDTMDLIVSKMAHGKTLSTALHEVYTKRNVVIPYDDQWLDCDLRALRMSPRTTAALLRNKLRTIQDVVEYTYDNKITNLAMLGRISALELFEKILDYCWEHMSQKEKDAFLIDTVERNGDYLKAEIMF